ncbi:MAG: EAL domain-containing protein [Bacteroidetes bacterium]|nr:EAL domain-containing protein [Bacteroidota bacterium]
MTKLSNEVIKDNMIKFKNKNISFIMDCYGNQNTNLIDLVEYPFAVVKIDRNFAWYAMENEKAKKILEEMIVMLKSVKKKVVVVGIETSEQAAAFTKMGSDYLQGFYFSVPLPAEEFIAFLKRM